MIIGRYPRSKSSGSSFSPLDITGCQLWLDASDSSTITLNGADVAQWNDKSGNNNNLGQTVVARQPFYNISAQNSLNVVDFTWNELTSIVDFDLTSTDKLTVFMVLKNDRDATEIIIEQAVAGGNPGSPEGGLDIINIAGGDCRGFVKTNAAVGNYSHFSPVALTDWNIITYQFDIAQAKELEVYKVFEKGIEKTLTIDSATKDNTANFPSEPLTIGARPINVLPWDGKMGEVIIYDTVLSTADRESVEAYLTRWAIT